MATVVHSAIVHYNYPQACSRGTVAAIDDAAKTIFTANRSGMRSVYRSPTPGNVGIINHEMSTLEAAKEAEERMVSSLRRAGAVIISSISS